MSRWRITLEGWLKTIDVEGSVLDVGGLAKPVIDRVGSWDVNDYVIADNKNEPKGEYEKAINIEWDMSDVAPLELLSMGAFDNVFCLETMMYCKDPVTALSNLTLLTKKNLYISNPLEAYPETKPPGTDMHRLFPNWWRYWLERPSMEIKELIVVEPSYGRVNFEFASREEGYKVYRPHASGILIHAIKNDRLPRNS